MDNLDRQQINKILNEYSTDKFYLQYIDFYKEDPNRHHYIYQQVNNILSWYFSYNTIFDYNGYMVIARKYNGKNKRPDDAVIGVGIVNNEMIQDFYSNKIFEQVKPVKKAGMRETYIQYLATDPEYRSLVNKNEQAENNIKNIGKNILECIKELSRQDGKEAVSLYSVSNRKIIQFYNRHGLHSVHENGLMAINNYELESLGIINANILYYMSINELQNYDEFIQSVKHNKIDPTLFTQGCKNEVPGVIKEMMQPINTNTKNNAQKILNVNKLIIGELIRKCTQHEFEDPIYAAEHIDMYSELLVVNMDMQLPQDMNDICKQLPYDAANYLKEKYGNKELPLVNRTNPYLRYEDTVAKELNNEEIITCAKLLKSTQINYQAIFDKTFSR